MWETLNTIAQVWWNWQWAMLWQTALLLGIVVVIDLLIRKWAWPQLRYALWLLVLVKLLLPPGLTSSVSVTASLSQAARQRLIVSQPASSAPSVAPVTPPLAASIEPVMESTSFVAPSAMSTPRMQGTAPVEPTPKRTRVVWQVYVMCVWLMGILGLSLALGKRVRGLRRENHATDQPIPQWYDQELQQTAKALKLGRLPQVVVSHRVCCPAVFGLFRPVLLVPKESLATINRTDARHMLLHELAHIKRGDLWVHGLHMLLLIIYWCNPLLWLMRKHLQNLRELCCDATVARHLKEDTLAYRETLIETAKGLLAQPVDPGLGLLGLFENSSWLLTRLQWLEKKTWRYWRLRVVMVSLVVLIMTTCVLPMAQSQARTNDDVTDTHENSSNHNNSSTSTEIQILGLNNYPLENDPWWSPQGEILPPGTIEDPQWHTEDSTPEGHKTKVIAIQVTNKDLYDLGITWEIPNSNPSSYFPSYKNREAKLYSKVQYLLATFSKDKETATLSLGIASGDWQYASATDGQEEGYTFDSPTDRDVHLHKVRTQDGQVHISISHLMGRNYDCRIVAIDSHGIKHPPINNSNTGAQLKQCQASFDLPMEDIKTFELQARLYKWIEFKDIPLQPLTAEQLQALSNGVVYVIGDVARSGIIPFQKNSLLTLKQVIAMSGGVRYQTESDILVAEIRRRNSSGEEVVIRRELNKIADGSETDPHIQPNDTISIIHSSPERLTLVKPEYEWWLKEPKQQIVIDEGKELEIHWQIDQELYDAIDWFTLGVLPDGADVSEQHRYQWLAVGVPPTVRTSPYGKNWPSLSSQMREMSTVSKPLQVGNYSIIVFGFKGHGSEEAHWVRQLKGDSLKCVATAKLMVNGSSSLSSNNQPKEFPTQTYKVRPGDNLSKIGEMFKVPYQWIVKANNMEPDRLCVGQELVIPKGPVHAKVYRSSGKLELWFDNRLYKTYKVGLGQTGHETPPGVWLVEKGSKMIRPQWTDEAGRLLDANDPDYPLGERWIGLQGIEGEAVGRKGFAIHGTNEPESIGTYSTHGTICMNNQDIIEVYGLLQESVSQVEVVD